MRKIEEATRCASGPAKPLVSGDAADLTRGAFFGLSAQEPGRSIVSPRYSERDPWVSMFPFGIMLRNLQKLRRSDDENQTHKVLIEFPRFGEPSCTPEVG